MKSLLESFVRRRNPHFALHPAVSTGILLSFGLRTAQGLLRGSRLWLRGRASGGAMLGAGVRFQHLGRIRFGKWLKVGDYARFSGLGAGGLTLGDSVSIGAFSQVIVSTSLAEPGQYIKLGSRVGIGEFAYLGGGGGLSIGDDCIIGQYFSCHPENHLHGDYQALIRLQGVTRRGISIGPNCWIGSKVTVLDGVMIGAGCVVAAGAVVTRSVPAGSVVAGVPARIIASRGPQPLTPEALTETLAAA
ncbi:MAG: acyltransferase [Hymenobacter sp.]|nr:MAG: acyltransferase [Hymenobacter sp.]